MDYIAIVVGLLLLIKGGDWLLDAAVGLSLKFNIPKIVIGMTVVSFATSAPELIVSIQAAMSGHADLSIGNVVGSNIANLAFVLAIVIIISPIDVTKSFYTTDWPAMIFATVLFYFFIAFDGVLSSYEGGILFFSLIFFIIYLIKYQKPAVIEEISEIEEVLSYKKISYYFILGSFCLWLGSEALVGGAVSIAKSLGVSERIISISILSIGTSIPELSASLIAIINKQKAISLGNLIGSNIFNLLAVMGITSMIVPIHAGDNSLINRDMIWMIAISIIILPLVFFPKKKRLGPIDGIILLGLYFFFLIPLLYK